VLEESSNYKYYSFDVDNSILYHEVSSENCGTKESFVLSMSTFMSLMEKFKPRYIIIKVLKRPDYFEQELDSFMKSTVYKLIRDLNIQKIGYYMKYPEYIPGLRPHEQDKNLKIKFFSSLEETQQWILGELSATSENQHKPEYG